jgi:hypothetical protein
MQAAKQTLNYLLGRNTGYARRVDAPGVSYTSTGAPGMADVRTVTDRDVKHAEDTFRRLEDHIKDLHWRIKMKNEIIDGLQHQRALSDAEFYTLSTNQIQLLRLQSDLFKAKAEYYKAADVLNDLIEAREVSTGHFNPADELGVHPQHIHDNGDGAGVGTGALGFGAGNGGLALGAGMGVPALGAGGGIGKGKGRGTGNGNGKRSHGTRGTRHSHRARSARGRFVKSRGSKHGKY